MKKYDYIFWDMDGTIANTYEGVSNCIKYALEPYGFMIAEKDIVKFIGPPLRQAFPKHCGLSPEQTEEAVKKFRERYIPIGVYECEMFPGVKETLERFHDAGYIQVLTSSKPEGQCHNILKKFGILELFDEVVGASLDGKIDTKIQVLNEAFRRMEVKGEDFDKSKVVLIGDTHYDAVGAQMAGIDCIGVSYGFGTEEELMENGALAVYPNLEELLKAIL